MIHFIEKYFFICLVQILKYLFVAGTFYILYYIFLKKTMVSAKIQNKNPSKKRIKNEIFQSFLASIIIPFLICVVLYSPLVGYTQLYQNINDYSFIWLFLSVLIGLLIHDTYFYWLHRLLHHKKAFRYTHYVHHESNNPNPFTSYSFNIIESFAEGLIVPILLFTIPLHPIAIYTFIMMSFIINVYGHLGYEISPKWFRKSFLFGIINTSVYHNLHHSKFKGNYGLYFRFWDRMMNTENPNYVEVYDKIQERRFRKI
jgi:lathosterol oxidase